MMMKIKLLHSLGLGLLLLCTTSAVFAQANLNQEVLPYQERDGYMIIRANVGGTEGDFLLDSRGAVGLTEAAAVKRQLKISKTLDTYSRAGYELSGKGRAPGFFIGNVVYSKDISVVVFKASPLLEKLKVDGVIGFNAFIGTVLTLNTKLKTMTLSSPYRPDYMKLNNRQEAKLKTGGLFMDILVNGKTIKAVADFYQDQPLVLTATDFDLLQPGKTAELKLANQNFEKIPVVKAAGDQAFNVLGKSILKQGMISFDVGRGKYYFQPFNNGEDQTVPVVKKETMAIVPGKINPVDRAYFLKHIYDYKAGKEWKAIGDKPVVIDFWATWCGPCLKLMPVMEELAAKYKDRVVFYKVNVDKEGELRQVFDANAIPLLIFGSVNNGAVREVGGDTKEKIEARILKMLQ
ncbi:thioredoxin domain-containing protein [Pedobacter sp. PLR]|uniref:thioredoxin domain-containing protein n=1 Tax=Pedobacter sp. PLR TaxID=2994465 RepID=UPI002246CF36|nr:thioredoxin domain-containing protein [Pedobacter sp. PLR]MCX2452621.1 thioredoxin domain-containing protein [Pedobacter sp. PLR]